MGNTQDGIYISEASGNTIAKNRSENNGGDGFDARSSGNMFEMNEARKNGRFGFLDSGTPGPANTYVNNQCSNNPSGESSPPGLCKP